LGFRRYDGFLARSFAVAAYSTAGLIRCLIFNNEERCANFFTPMVANRVLEEFLSNPEFARC
jgi:hypothetical protein